jgi:integrase
MSKRQGTLYPGVYKREATGRAFKGKKDVGFDITYHNDGKKVWERVGWLSDGYSAKLAADILAKRKMSLRHSEDLPKEKRRAPFFRDAAGEFLEWARENHTRQGKDSRIRYEVHLKGHLGEKWLNEISSFDLERLKADLLKKGLSPATVRHCLVLVRQIFNKAVTWGKYQGLNPVKGVKLPTLQNQRTRFLSHEEASRLLGHLIKMKTPDLHDMALLSLHTGIRAGEIFLLRGQDIDLVNAIITIRDTKNTATRHAYMTESVKELLTRRIAPPDVLIFPDKQGNQAQAISQSFRKAVNALGFNEGVKDRRERVFFHTLRHTFASWLALQGETLLTIKELLGHKSLVMTERYSHLIPDHKRRATLALGKGLDTTMTGRELDKVVPLTPEDQGRG